MDRWVGKVAVVTGASSGIGRATAIALANHGIKTVGLARRVENIEEASKNVTGKGSLKGIKCDLRNTKEIKSAFEWIEKNIGPVSILVNNAGMGGSAPVADVSQEEVNSIIDINLTGVITCTKEALSMMSRHGINDGHIVIINSVCGHIVIPTKKLAVYTASKFGIRAFAEALKNELALDKSNIRITSVCPGLVDTEMVQKLMKRKLPEGVPKLFDTDVSDCVVFALSAPKHVNVSEITVQGVGEIFKG